MGGRELFLLQMNGGPHPGARSCRDGDVYGGITFTWPLPDVLPDEGGLYRKRNESQLPPMPADSHVVRGAEYEWEATS